jgi:hypothetical protein
MPRFIAFHPCPVSCWDKIYRFPMAVASPRHPAQKRTCWPSRAALVNQSLSGTRQRANRSAAKTGDFPAKRTVHGDRARLANQILTKMERI